MFFIRKDTIKEQRLRGKDKDMEDRAVRVVVTAPLGVGGVTNMMINIQSHIDRSKVNFDYLVYHDRKEPLEEKVLEMGSKKLVASVDNIPVRPLRRLLRINKIREVCKKNHVKILHYNADSAADMTNIIGAKLGGVKYITIHSHNAGFGTAGIGVKLASALLKPLIPLICDNYWACSDLAARFLFPKSVIKAGNYEVIPNGIELNKYAYNSDVRKVMRKRLGVEEKFVIGNVGRFSAQKNHTFLIDIFNKVQQRNSNTVLLLFGVGELMEMIKTKVRDLGIEDKVIFYGVSNEMEKMWQAMDVFVMPSLHEGLPVTGVEAQASGLPCVFADTITKEIGLTDNCQFLSLNDSEERWIETILSYKDLERKSGVQALLKARYDIQQTADRVAELYTKMVKNY